jgi:hypothetical protein
MRMRSKTGLLVTSILVVAAATGVAFLLMRRGEMNKHAVPTQIAVVDRASEHASKPSPAVHLDEKKPMKASDTSASANLSAATGQPWPPDGMQFAAHHKGHKGCDGPLTLKTSELQFVCPSDEGKSFVVLLSEIRGTDDDGIITRSGDKYHFDKLPGGGRDYANKVFSDWLARGHAQAQTQ